MITVLHSKPKRCGHSTEKSVSLLDPTREGGTSKAGRVSEMAGGLLKVWIPGFQSESAGWGPGGSYLANSPEDTSAVSPMQLCSCFFL